MIVLKILRESTYLNPFWCYLTLAYLKDSRLKELIAIEKKNNSYLTLIKQTHYVRPLQAHNQK